MSDDGFSFELGLEDGVTSVAGAESRALKDLTKEIYGAERGLKALIVQQRALKSQGMPIDSVYAQVLKNARRELSELKREQKELTGGGGTNAGSGLFANVLGANLLASALRRVGFAAVEAYGKVRAFVIEAAEMKQASILEYGGGAEGEDLFRRVNQKALETHLPADQAHELARNLKLQGLEDADLITATIQSRAELIRTGQVKGAEKLQSIIEKSLASGHFDPGKGLVGKGGAAGSGRALAGLGVHLPDLFADLAKRYKTDIPTVQRLLKEGKIETEVGIAALDEAISKGDVGKAARKMFTLADFKTDVFNQLTRSAQSVDLSKFNQALVDADVSLGLIAGKGGPIEAFFQMMVDGSANAIDGINAWVDGFYLAFLEVENAGKEFRNWMVDHGMGFLIGAERTSGGGIAHTVEQPEDLTQGSILPGLDNWIDKHSTPEAALQIWKDITKSISGPASTAAAEEGGGDMGAAVEKGLRDRTQVHSPSPLFAGIGEDMASSVVTGWQKVGIGGAVSSSLAGATSAPSGGGQGRSVTIQWYGDVVNHGGEPDDAGKRATWLAAFTEVSEQFALELGSDG